MSAQPIDPRLEAADAAQYRGPRQQPAPYPAPVSRPDSAQVKLYREGDHQAVAAAATAAAHPYYYPLQPARSPSDELPDRRESAGGPDMADMSPSGQAAHDAKRSRACEACRGLKVRCDMDNPDQPCKRCAKAGRQCIVTQPSRRRHKKADTRVAELEKKIDALTAVIQAQQYQPDQRQLPPPDLSQPGDGDPRHDDYEDQERRKRRRLDDHQQPPPPLSHSQSHSHPLSQQQSQPPAQPPQQQQQQQQQDKYKSILVSQGLYADFAQHVKQRVRSVIDWNVACDVYANFRDNLIPQFPVIVLSADATAESVFESKPMLFLCILATGCANLVPPALHDTLTDEVFDLIATAAIRKGIKTLEIIQGLQIAFLWHRPPERPVQGNFYLLIHLAVVMALDVGLGKPYNPLKAKRGFGGPGSDLPPGAGAAPIDSDTCESRRTWLCCYYTAASAAQVLRRPNLLRWSNYMQECIEVLETSPEASSSDRLLAQHVRIQRICEEISVSFAMEDPSATSISILDPKVAYTLNVLEEKLNDWEANVPPDLKIPSLMYFKHVTSLYLHEIAMHVNHNTEDFRVPFTEASLKSGSQYSQTLTQKQMASIEACLKATHNIVGLWCDFSPDTISTLPTLLYFVRLVYALIVLIKMHVAATSPGSELGKVIKPEDIKVTECLDRSWHCIQNLLDGRTSRAFLKAQQILGLLRDWIASHPNGDNTAPQVSKEAVARAVSAQRYSQRENDSLRVLSEAATAGAERAQQRASWSFDTPYGGFGNSSRNPETPDMPARTPSDAYTTGATNYPPTVMSTPGSIHNHPMPATDAQNSYPNMFDPNLVKQNGGNGMEWTSGLDFEQAIDVALSNLDYSGDMFGQYF